MSCGRRHRYSAVAARGFRRSGRVLHNPLDLVPQTLNDERLVLAGYSTPLESDNTDVIAILQNGVDV
jgi:hypothetical protein